jgi:TonB family protein
VQPEWFELLMSAVWKTTLILSLAAAADLFLRRWSAAARHWFWVLVLAGLLVLLLPPPEILRVDVPAQATPVATLSVLISATKADIPIWTDWVIRLWLIGTGLMLLRLTIATWRTRKAIAKAEPVRNAEWEETLWMCREQLAVKCDVELRFGEPGVIPMVWGWQAPVILLPADATGWPEERRRLVLLHELAHIQRRDCLLQIPAFLSAAVYWFHPLVWWGLRRLQRERERACDDYVLNSGAPASFYAGQLLEFARSLKTVVAATPAASPMARPSQLEGRLLAILNAKLDRKPVQRQGALAMALLTMVIVISVSVLRALPESSGRITGRILDASGAAIPSAQIAARYGAYVRSAISGPAGDFIIEGLPAGEYQLDVRAPGFVRYMQSIALRQGRIAQVRPVLDVGRIVESMTIRSKRAESPGESLPGSAERVRVGGDVTPARSLRMPRAGYPAEAKKLGIEGEVMLEAVILMDGSLGKARVISSPHPILAQAALDTIREWRYEPVRLNGAPVESITQVTLNFRLE